MAYWIPIVINENGEPQDIFTTFTNRGRVVVIAEESSGLTEYLTLGSQIWLDDPTLRLAAFDLDAPSFPAAVQKLVALDPSVSQTGTFIEDTDPVFARLLDQIRHQASAGY